MFYDQTTNYQIDFVEIFFFDKFYYTYLLSGRYRPSHAKSALNPGVMGEDSMVISCASGNM